MVMVTDRVAVGARTPAALKPAAPGAGPMRPAKRLVDVVLGTLLAAVSLPVTLGLAGALALKLRAWPFFVHDRLGQHGRTFPCPKLRTLPPSTHRYADKTTSDLRPACRLAAFLRARHLDELPQLLLVPMGVLSVVGPRPKMPDEHEPIDPLPGQARTLVRQGCTGLWQVSVRNGNRVADGMVYDLFYLRYGSLRMDMWILWRTLAQTFGAPGVKLSDVPRWTLGRGFIEPAQQKMVEQAMAASMGAATVPAGRRHGPA